MRRAIVLATLVGCNVFGDASAAEVFGPAAVQPASHTFTVGKLKLTVLHDAQYVIPNDAKTFGVDAGAAAVSDLLRSSTLPTDRITVSINALLVRTGKRVLLLDSGLGAKNKGTLIASLHDANVSPNAITDVLITHSHGDHVGGLLNANGGLAFPKATLRMSSAEWTAMQKTGTPDLVKAIARHVKTFEPGATLAPGVTAIALDGHTPGHVGYEIVSGQVRLLDIGDLAHSSVVSLAKPQWTLGFDNDPSVAKATRVATLSRLAKDQELIFAPHFPYPGIGHIKASADAFAWKPGVP